MEPRASFSDQEIELLVDLLQRERRDLPAQIHHTDSHDLRERFKARQHLIEALLDRLQKMPVG
jgi:hypothetical protein